MLQNELIAAVIKITVIMQDYSLKVNSNLCMMSLYKNLSVRARFVSWQTADQYSYSCLEVQQTRATLNCCRHCLHLE